MHNRLGSAYQKSGCLDKSISAYKKALFIRPDLLPALNNLTIVYSIIGEYDNAISALYKILELRPENPDVYYNIACMHAKQNNLDESINWLKSAIEKGFSDWELLENDNDLENIRSSSDYRELLIRHKGTE